MTDRDSVLKDSVAGILEEYLRLLGQVDQWFAACLQHHPQEIACAPGCSACCRGIFDITLLDAWLLKAGFDRLDGLARQRIADRAGERLRVMRLDWPEFAPPFLLNDRPEADWESLMPDDDETPCVLLEDGSCLLYNWRPMTCRLNGIPYVDVSGEVLFDEWCTLNFTNLDPLADRELRGNFRAIFTAELDLFHELTTLLFGHRISELDTFIPLALLVDYGRFPWADWLSRTRLVTNPTHP